MDSIKKLSIVIPVYNEAKTIRTLLDRVLRVDIGDVAKEIIIVDDGSNDNTKVIIKNFGQIKNLVVLFNKKNGGKTWALRQGFKKVSGDVVVVQDGDLEYNPGDFLKMLEKMRHPGVRVVYGSRRLNKDNKQYSGLGFYLGGVILTALTNMLYSAKISDESTCYKMFDAKLLRSIDIKSKRFEFCPEITAKVCKLGHKIYEVPISYKPRHIKQGKKIKLRDFLDAVWVLVKYRFVN